MLASAAIQLRTIAKGGAVPIDLKSTLNSAADILDKLSRSAALTDIEATNSLKTFEALGKEANATCVAGD